MLSFDDMFPMMRNFHDSMADFSRKMAEFHKLMDHIYSDAYCPKIKTAEIKDNKITFTFDDNSFISFPFPPDLVHPSLYKVKCINDAYISRLFGEVLDNGEVSYNIHSPNAEIDRVYNIIKTNEPNAASLKSTASTKTPKTASSFSNKNSRPLDSNGNPIPFKSMTQDQKRQYWRWQKNKNK